ncbi:ribosome hibernation-promoting factor, HPF/YfiA family [Altericroceibacterium xinjiangense]|uniref:ribosome hibernation-promoting factor, HPF/YfiA family n=1 Tax=Altericroceibacterium xinjiangense TaxID=762261 RepID=UPI000F7EF248|nr:ribosome-associated translation inhibitor RaiA [Altericroceibacterium xinjiangense]
MEIRISGHQVETGEALQDHATARLNAIVEKYFSRAQTAVVTLGKTPPNAFACDIVMYVVNGLVLKSRAESPDAHQAFDGAADKVEKQLRRYKRRLKDRHERASFVAEAEDAAYTVFAPREEAESQDEEDDGAQEADYASPVIAETRVDIPEVSVSDAVMMLDLRHTNALFFKNAGTGRHNMVYRRDDGSIGWVEPS